MDDTGRYLRDPVIRGLCRAIGMTERYGWLMMTDEYPTVPGRQVWMVVFDKETDYLFNHEGDRWFCLSSPFEGQWKDLIDMLGLNDPDALDAFYERARAIQGGE